MHTDPMAYSSLTDSRRKARMVHTAQGAFLASLTFPFVLLGVFLAVDRWTYHSSWKPRPVPPHSRRPARTSHWFR